LQEKLRRLGQTALTKCSCDIDIIDIDDNDKPPAKTQHQSQAGPSMKASSTAVLSIKVKRQTASS
jgi:hypothetical protein